MTYVLASRPVFRRKRQPEDPGAGAVVFFSLIAASGFAVGWAAQVAGVF